MPATLHSRCAFLMNAFGFRKILFFLFIHCINMFSLSVEGYSYLTHFSHGYYHVSFYYFLQLILI